MVSLTALVLLALPLGIVALYVRFRMGGPVIFAQLRPGLNGKPFKMYKFRTMTNACGPDGQLLPAVERLTSFGRKLRSTSIDELPELWNVIRGDMSLVGPRPLLMEYLPLYSEFEAKRHNVRPGITGWAQINGRNALTWHEKFELDVWYVYNQSISLDLKILLMTVKKVFIREGIGTANSEIMPKFIGHQKSISQGPK